MTRFLGGPAEGKVLTLKNAPRWLRVVVDGKGEVDALDAPHDAPRADETVHLYVRQGEALGRFHMSFRGERGGRRGVSGVSAIYRYLDAAQPSREEVATGDAWEKTMKRLERDVPV